ncbi:MAG: hypothetical protein RL266_2602 [Bacteroidota bacterium]|jgi:1-acyl-sn-glycerol-3-phosphate acyltransferase
MGVILIIVRSLVFIVLTITCTVLAMLGSVPFGHKWALGMQKLWSVVMLWVFGVHTVRHGPKPKVGLMLSNHLSYLDIWMIPKYAITVFVAKAEVKKMPLVGWGASAVDTVYVDRSSKESRLATKSEIATRIRKGRSVIVFPEGTTGDGNGLLPLKPGMFHVAAEEGFPIIPTAIYYEEADLAWVGDDSMGAHFYRNFSKWSTTAHIAFGEPMTGTDGEELMERYRLWVLAKLEELKNTSR